MKNIRFNWKSGRAWGEGISRWLMQVPYLLLIERFIVIRLFLLIGLLLIALVVAMKLLYLNSDSVGTDSADRPPPLNTELIDELEVWVEERQSERERPIIGPEREYFKR